MVRDDVSTQQQADSRHTTTGGQQTHSSKRQRTSRNKPSSTAARACAASASCACAASRASRSASSAVHNACSRAFSDDTCDCSLSTSAAYRAAVAFSSAAAAALAEAGAGLDDAAPAPAVVLAAGVALPRGAPAVPAPLAAVSDALRRGVPLLWPGDIRKDDEDPNTPRAGDTPAPLEVGLDLNAAARRDPDDRAVCDARQVSSLRFVVPFNQPHTATRTRTTASVGARAVAGSQVDTFAAVLATMRRDIFEEVGHARPRRAARIVLLRHVHVDTAASTLAWCATRRCSGCSAGGRRCGGHGIVGLARGLWRRRNRVGLGGSGWVLASTLAWLGEF